MRRGAVGAGLSIERSTEVSEERWAENFLGAHYRHTVITGPERTFLQSLLSFFLSILSRAGAGGVTTGHRRTGRGRGGR